jgi:hypothetical protein
MRKLGKIAWILLCVGLSPASFAVAGDFDGSQPLLCATIKAIECGMEGECSQGTAESVNIPQFFRINFKEKMISATRETGDKRTSRIRHLDHMQGKLILQGMGDDLAWSLAVSEETGKVVITASGDQVGFVVFGACTPL